MKKIIGTVFKRTFFLLKFYQSIPAFFSFFGSKRITKKKKALYLALMIGYLLLPTGDFIPVLGWLDDATVFSWILYGIHRELTQKDSQTNQSTLAS